VSCPSSSFCAAVDEDGNALTYNGSAWSSPVAVDAGHNLTMLSCPSASFCMASDGTDAVIYNGGSWSAPASIEGANGTVQALSCASSSLCAAVDFTGNSVSNALIYNGSAWSAPDPIDPNTSMYWGFTSVSCPSASFCMAADASGYTWVYNGSSWTQAASVGQSGILQQVSCASSTSCLAEQWFGATYSWNGTSWSELPAPDNPTTLPLDLSCPTAAFCGAVDGLDEALTYTTGAPNPPTTTTAPSIAGAAQQGQTLTETHASWSPAPTGYTISWERCESSGASCASIPGAGGQSYTLTAADVGHTIRVSETASGAGGNSQPATSSPTGVVSGPPSPPPGPGATAPKNTSAPTVTGQTQVGKTLTASQGSWSGTAPVSYVYQWQACATACVNIPGQTGGTLTLAPAQAGKHIDVVVTASNSAGHASATSVQVGAVQPSAGQVQSALRGVSAKHAKGKKAAFTLAFHAPSAGRLKVSFYYLPKHAHLATAHVKPVLLRPPRLWRTVRGPSASS
jgi:hypothetical protein